MNNDLINELNNKIDAQDKIINTQALEIARLNERINDYENPDDMTLMFMWCDEKAKDKIKDLQTKIDKAIELAKIRIESCNAGLSNAETSIVSKHSLLRLEIQSYKELLEILGDKE